MHASRGAFPFLGCKGSDTIVILKWLMFLCGLHLAEGSWSPQHRQVLTWMRAGAEAGLAFSQGIHGHGIWLKQNCVRFLKSILDTFGSCYAWLASYCLSNQYNLFGMVPKLHAMMHFSHDMNVSLQEHREFTLNPCTFDNSMSEDYIGRIARQSRRISFRLVEKTLLSSSKTKAYFEIQRYKKRRLI